jgi:multidrug efflux pump subunit AcrB
MSTSIIRSFVRHPVAPNLAMLLMIIAGIWALSQLNRQLLPTFQLNVITVAVQWTGASAEDVEQGITQPLEDQLLGLADLSKISSTSRDGSAQVSLEFPDSVNIGDALDRVKERVAQVRNLPQTAEDPTVSQLARTDPLMRLVVSGASIAELRPAVRLLEREFRAAGISRLEITGLPREEIAIQVSSQQLNELGLPINELASMVAEASLDVPAGSAGRSDVARSLRTSGQRRDVAGFNSLPFMVGEGGQRLTLADIAQVERRSIDGEAALYLDGAPAVEIRIRRSESEDAIDVATLVYGIIEANTNRLPPNARIGIYDETWRLVDERLQLMIDNGIAGLLLVVMVLYVFLNARVAFWVAVGIPVSVMAAMMALHLFGGSINMISMFAMVMAMGIIVDDAIVVGEQAVTEFQNGSGPVAAAENAALRMLPPVAASSLTTVAAFMPLLALSGATGSILFAIPLVIICVVVASLLECFVVLPGHLRHSLAATAKHPAGRLRRLFDVAFRRVRDRHVRAAVCWAVSNRRMTVAIGFACLIVSVGLLSGGRLGFAFFPQPDNTTMFANARFVAGSPENRVSEFLDQASRILESQLAANPGVHKLTIKRLGEDSRGNTGTHLGHLSVELADNDDRNISNAEIITAWRAAAPRVPGLESFDISSGVHGPPGADIEIQFSGARANTLKSAALEVESILKTFVGVSGVRADTAYGREQLIFGLTPAGQAAGLSEQSLSAQLRSAFEGELVQIFQDEGEEVEVRMMLPDAERDSLGRLETLPIVLPGIERVSIRCAMQTEDLQLR